MWRETTKHERNRRIFEEELDDFLPQEILDFHVHVFPKGTMPEGKTYSCAGHPIAHYDLDDLDTDLAEAFPGRKTRAVCFGFPRKEYDREANNAYVRAACDGERFFPFRLFDPVDDTPESVRADFESGGFVGLKPYLTYVPKADPNDVEVREMLPEWVMEIMHDCEAVVMLHLPRKGRLADPVNQQQVVELCEAWPKARIVLAHVGRAYYLKNVVGHLDRFKDLPNLYYDIAMVNHPEVIEYLFRTVSQERVLFGSDTPIALAPGKSIEINDQYTYVTPVPWDLSISDDHGKLVFTSFLYEILRGVKQAAERANLSDDFLRRFFFENGMEALRSAARSS